MEKEKIVVVCKIIRGLTTKQELYVHETSSLLLPSDDETLRYNTSLYMEIESALSVKYPNANAIYYKIIHGWEITIDQMNQKAMYPRNKQDKYRGYLCKFIDNDTTVIVLMSNPSHCICVEVVPASRLMEQQGLVLNSTMILHFDSKRHPEYTNVFIDLNARMSIPTSTIEDCTFRVLKLADAQMESIVSAMDTANDNTKRIS